MGTKSRVPCYSYMYMFTTPSPAGYQNPVPFVLLVLILHPPDICSKSTGIYCISEKHTVQIYHDIYWVLPTNGFCIPSTRLVE